MIVVNVVIVLIGVVVSIGRGTMILCSIVLVPEVSSVTSVVLQV